MAGSTRGSHAVDGGVGQRSSCLQHGVVGSGGLSIRLPRLPVPGSLHLPRSSGHSPGGAASWEVESGHPSSASP